MSKNSGGSFKTETPQESRPPIRRCAVYARVSTSNRGDDQLTALEAQIQSCKDYIKSQRGMGWELIEPIYVDNGLSGGNINRPALRQLINDMEAGKIDAVVIQRLDRLSRNLRDMADMMPLFTIPKISLISINQSLDTETPLGRLAIHTLASFGQFEREISGERTRDKIAAARATGKWQHNGVPLGYAIDDKQELQLDLAEMMIVADIFWSFLVIESVSDLLKELEAKGYRTKVRISQNGNIAGGKLIDRNALYRILNNRMYLGEIFYSGKWHPGMHHRIITQERWDQVHLVMEHRARRKGVRTTGPEIQHFPLGDRLYWEDGRKYKMYESNERHIMGDWFGASKDKLNAKRYRYYQSPATAEEREKGKGPRNIPAELLNQTVIDYIRAQFKNPEEWLRKVPEEFKGLPEFNPEHVISYLGRLDDNWDIFVKQNQALIIRDLVSKVTMQSNPAGANVEMSFDGLRRLLIEGLPTEKESKKKAVDEAQAAKKNKPSPKLDK